MRIRHILLCASSLVVGCMGAELSEEEYLRRQQSENLCLNLQEQAEAGNKMASYALANYHYFGNQFIDDPEKMKSSYYKADDGKTRIYYRLNNVEVKPEDYEKAFKLYEQAALHEHWFSLWSLGECYELGRGTDQDLVKAAECYRKASKAGCSFAQRSLGLMYLDGSGGLPRSESEALKLFREAANNGLASAQYNLGMMYVLGKGTRRNETEAVKWLQKAADQGDARAWSNLGEMHQDGRGGLKKNEQKALECYSKACDQGYEKIRPRFNALKEKFQVQEKKQLQSKFVSSRSNHKFDMSSISSELGHAQICMASGQYARAAHHFQNAANQGDERAWNSLGLMYEDGQGVPQNNVKAAECYRKAAEKGHDKAQANLGRMYREGLGVPQDDREAAKWYRQSADQGFVGGQNNLASLYLQGRGIEKNLDKAILYYTLAAKQGYGPAQLKLAEIYRTLEDRPSAKEWSERAQEQDYTAAGYSGVYLTERMGHIDVGQVRKAAEQGDVESQYQLGKLYIEGSQGLKKDLDKAKEWLTKASEQEDCLSGFLLGMIHMEGQTEQGRAEAMKWFEKAARNDPCAQSVFKALSKTKNIIPDMEKITHEEKVEQPEEPQELEQWYPSDGFLIHAGKFIMDLKREKGTSPTEVEMISCLQDKMKISAERVKIILEELGFLG